MYKINFKGPPCPSCMWKTTARSPTSTTTRIWWWQSADAGDRLLLDDRRRLLIDLDFFNAAEVFL